jgi:HECT-domain (ubiquitin-transferase)
VVVQLKDVLRFATGAEAVPARGFPERPSVHFDHSSSAVGRLPTANICYCRLIFPVWNGLCGENEKVAIDIFTRAIVEGQTFSTV